jgi:hypothetical protein
MKKRLIIAVCILGVIASCAKKYDEPEVVFPVEGQKITLDSLLGLYQGYPIKFDKDLSMNAIVTMDETDGNIYKSVYIQDGNDAINMRLLSGGGLYKGDSIRIDLKGTVLNQYNGVMQLDSVDIDKNIVKQAVNVNLPPLVLPLDQLNTNLQSRLVKLENVQFIKPHTLSTYADGDELISYDLMLEDANGNTAIVRNSGYSNFADEMVAQGSGSLVAVVGIFGNSVQLAIRSFAEVNMNGPRFNGIQFSKNFDDGFISSEGWQQYSVSGEEIQWETSSAGGAETDYAVIRNYNGTANIECENWMISPGYDLSNVSSPTLSFDNAYKYTGPNLEVYISTNYDGTSNPTTQGTWNLLSPMWSPGNFVFANSGDVDISAYAGVKTHIAFKYSGGASDGATWELDNIYVKGQ